MASASARPSPGKVVRVWLVRHGETQRMATGELVADDPLSPRGQEQASALYASFGSKWKWGADKVFVSPLRRALETAVRAFLPPEDATAAGTTNVRGLKPHMVVDARLREFRFDQEASSSGGELFVRHVGTDVAELRRAFRSASLQWGASAADSSSGAVVPGLPEMVPGTEWWEPHGAYCGAYNASPTATCTARVRDFLDSIYSDECTAHGDTVCIVAHENVFRVASGLLTVAPATPVECFLTQSHTGIETHDAFVDRFRREGPTRRVVSLLPRSFVDAAAHSWGVLPGTTDARPSADAAKSTGSGTGKTVGVGIATGAGVEPASGAAEVAAAESQQATALSMLGCSDVRVAAARIDHAIARMRAREAEGHRDVMIMPVAEAEYCDMELFIEERYLHSGAMVNGAGPASGADDEVSPDGRGVGGGGGGGGGGGRGDGGDNKGRLAALTADEVGRIIVDQNSRWTECNACYTALHLDAARTIAVSDLYQGCEATSAVAAPVAVSSLTWDVQVVTNDWHMPRTWMLFQHQAELNGWDAWMSMSACASLTTEAQADALISGHLTDGLILGDRIDLYPHLWDRAMYDDSVALQPALAVVAANSRRWAVKTRAPHENVSWCGAVCELIAESRAHKLAGEDDAVAKAQAVRAAHRVYRGCVRLMRAQLPAPIATVNDRGWTLLHVAAEAGASARVAEGLLYFVGCSPAFKSSDGETALDVAERLGHVEFADAIRRALPHVVPPADM